MHTDSMRQTWMSKCIQKVSFESVIPVSLSDVNSWELRRKK